MEGAGIITLSTWRSYPYRLGGLAPGSLRCPPPVGSGATGGVRSQSPACLSEAPPPWSLLCKPGRPLPSLHTAHRDPNARRATSPRPPPPGCRSAVHPSRDALVQTAASPPRGQQGLLRDLGHPQRQAHGSLSPPWTDASRLPQSRDESATSSPTSVFCLPGVARAEKTVVTSTTA